MTWLTRLYERLNQPRQRLAIGYCLLAFMSSMVGFLIWSQLPGRPFPPLVFFLLCHIFVQRAAFHYQFRMPAVRRSVLMRAPTSSIGHVEKVGVVLCGGGGKGAYQLGALKAIQDAGITFSLIAGTSAGALNGALFLSVGITRAIDIWKTVGPRLFRITLQSILVGALRAYAYRARFLQISRAERPYRLVSLAGITVGGSLCAYPYLYSTHLFLFFAAQLWFSGSLLVLLTVFIWLLCEQWGIVAIPNQRLLCLLEEYVSLDIIRRGDVELVVTVSEELELFDPRAPGSGGISLTYTPDYAEIGRLSDIDAFRYLTASASIPFGVFGPLTVQGKRLVDGGVTDNAPIMAALMHGCTTIIVIHTNNTGLANGRMLTTRQTLVEHLLEVRYRSALAQKAPSDVLAAYRKEVGKVSGFARVFRGQPPHKEFLAELDNGVLEKRLSETKIISVIPSAPLGSLIESIVSIAPGRVQSLVDLGYRDARSSLAYATAQEGAVEMQGDSNDDFFGRLGSISRTPESTMRKRDRRRLIQRVRYDWISSVLHPSLEGIKRIDVPLTNRPDLVESPLEPNEAMTRQQSQRSPRIQVHDAFARYGGQLLLVGPAGSGKTTFLLNLTETLLRRADKQPSYAVPVVFLLSSWTIGSPSLEHWLARQLNESYGAPLREASAWIREGQVIPLLDGFDEVSHILRESLVEAINSFQQRHGGLPIVVCSREDEYSSTTQRLRLSGALRIGKLDRPNVEKYLRPRGKRTEVLRRVLDSDPTLWQLFDTPLMLSIGIMAFDNSRMGSVPRLSTPNRTEYIFARYIKVMLASKPSNEFTAEESVTWLRFLASSMVRLGEPAFHLESLNLSWMPTRRLVRRFMLIFLVLSGLAGGFIFQFNLRAFFVGIGFGLASGMFLRASGARFDAMDALTWSWRKSISAFPVWALVGLALGVIGALGIDRFGALLFGPVESILLAVPGMVAIQRKNEFRLPAVIFFLAFYIVGVVILPGESNFRSLLRCGVIAGVISAMVASLGAGVISGMIPERLSPGEGTRRSLVVAWVVTFTIPLIGIPFEHVSWGHSLVELLNMITLPAALLLGGAHALERYSARIVLTWAGLCPWRYVEFLDYAVERLLLHKVGGGYIFRHRALMEYCSTLTDVDGR